MTAPSTAAGAARPFMQANCTQDELDRLRSINAELLAALEGVVAVADRKTDEFDAARAALARAKES